VVEPARSPRRRTPALKAAVLVFDQVEIQTAEESARSIEYRWDPVPTLVV
jgi:hypothetical protein